MSSPADIKKLLVEFAKAAKAPKKPDYLNAVLNITWDYSGKQVTGNFAFPLQTVTNDETGQVAFEVIDFLASPEPPQEESI